EGELRESGRHLDGPTDAIVCMVATLTHLSSPQAVEALLTDVAAALASPGVFVTTFRDYASATLEGTQRFIPVRSDAARSLTCFLEYGEETVTVYDMVHERAEGGVRFSVSSYPKLRLSPVWVVDKLTGLGFSVQQDVTARGMV